MRIVQKKTANFRISRRSLSHLRPIFWSRRNFVLSGLLSPTLQSRPNSFSYFSKKKSRKMARGLGEALDSLQKACFALTPFSSLIKPSAKRQRIALARRVLGIIAGAKKKMVIRNTFAPRRRTLAAARITSPTFRKSRFPEEYPP